MKSMISHQVDEARLAYGRLPIKRPRQFTLWGTSNKSEYSDRRHR